MHSSVTVSGSCIGCSGCIGTLAFPRFPLECDASHVVGSYARRDSDQKPFPANSLGCGCGGDTLPCQGGVDSCALKRKTQNSLTQSESESTAEPLPLGADRNCCKFITSILFIKGCNGNVLFPSLLKEDI